MKKKKKETNELMRNAQGDEGEGGRDRGRRGEKGVERGR